MPETKQYLLNIRNVIISSLSEQGLNDSDIGIIMNLHGSTIGRVLADGDLPIIKIPMAPSNKKVAKTSKVAVKKTATTKKVAKRA